MRWLLVTLVIACEFPLGRSVESHLEVEATTEVAREDPFSVRDAAPSLGFAPLRPPPAELDALPFVSRWMEDRRRCGARGSRRFCDGPRRAPESTGPSRHLARRLGLGTFRAAAELMRGSPRQEWIDAARGLGLEADALHWPIDDGRFGRGIQYEGRRIRHRGVDVTATVGTPIRAVADGLVAYANNEVQGYGNLLILLHGDEVSAYAHLSEIRVHAGQVVRQGQHVALAGNTGISRGPHLHFEWRSEGQITDPMPRFPRERSPEWLLREQGR